MFCVKCGSEIPEGGHFCPCCGAKTAPAENTANAVKQPVQSYPPPKINDYLVPSILVLIFCCLPLGIVALVYSIQTQDLIKRGDYAAAQEKSDKAKFWVLLSFILGIIFCCILYAER